MFPREGVPSYTPAVPRSERPVFADRPIPPRRLTIGAAALAGAVVLGGVLAAARPKPGELAVYMRAAERAVAGESFYDPADRPAFSYPPAFVAVTVPLVPLSDFGRRWAWRALNLALLGGVLVAVWRCVAPALGGNRTAAGRRRLWAWGGVTAALAVRFVLSPLQYQSHDLVCSPC